MKFVKSLSGFHTENSDEEEFSTFKINLLDGCSHGVVTMTPCGNWADLQNWNGIDVTLEDENLGIEDTYRNMIADIVDSVRVQMIANPLALTK